MTEECFPREGPRSVGFFANVYAVDIDDSWLLFGRRRSLQEVATVLAQEARLRGASLVTEREKCERIPRS